MNEEINLTDKDVNDIIDTLNFVHDPTKNKVGTYDYYDYGSSNRKYKKNYYKNINEVLVDPIHSSSKLKNEIEQLKARIKELEEENAELKLDIETYKNMEV